MILGYLVENLKLNTEGRVGINLQLELIDLINVEADCWDLNGIHNSILVEDDTIGRIHLPWQKVLD